MTEIDRVKKGLDNCLLPQGVCEECPYNGCGDVDECTPMLLDDSITLIDELDERVAIMEEGQIHCKDCQHWKPPHIVLNDGKQRLYIKGKEPSDPLGIGVTIDVGLNVGGKCWVDYMCGYSDDKRVFRNADDYCSRADRLPEGTTAEAFWGLSEEPAELLDD